ncbi:MAG: transposase [Terriglobia bacterium]
MRITRPESWYHLTARGNERRQIYRDDEDRQKFLALLELWLERYRIRLHAYVLMENHYHLLAETLEANLSEAMQWLNVSYSVWFNRRHRRVGHLFQGRFKAIVLDSQAWGLELSRYIHLNPVRRQVFALGKEGRRRNRAGLGKETEARRWAERVQALRYYRWSSYRAYVGLEESPLWLDCKELLRRLGGRPTGWRKAYLKYAEEGLREGIAAPWEQLQGQVVLGDREFIESLEGELQGNRREQPSLNQLEARPTWAAIVKAVETVKQEKWKQFRDRRGDWGRDVALYLGRKHGALKLKKLGELADVDYGSVSMALQRLEQRRQLDRQIAQHLREVESVLFNV